MSDSIRPVTMDDLVDVLRDVLAELKAISALIGRVAVNENGSVFTEKDPRS